MTGAYPKNFQGVGGFEIFFVWTGKFKEVLDFCKKNIHIKGGFDPKPLFPLNIEQKQKIKKYKTNFSIATF